MNRITVTCLCLLVFLSSNITLESYYKNKGTERQYQEYANKEFKGVIEKRLIDHTRVDIFVEGEYAIEVDFAKKWYEAIGQASHYSLLTETPPAILLIIQTDDDMKYLKKCRKVCNCLYILVNHKPMRYEVFHLDDRDGYISRQFNKKTPE